MMDGVKNLDELDRDQVMVKMGKTILPMKEASCLTRARKIWYIGQY
jgi:hypothetical protein